MDSKECYDRYAVGLYRFALSILKCPALAEDALQETFVKLLTGRPPSAGKEQAWLYRVIRNTCYDILRRRKREGEEVTAAGTDDFAYLELIAPLSQSEQEIVSLKIIGNLTHKEIANVLGITAHSAQKRYERAIQKLREMEGIT